MIANMRWFPHISFSSSTSGNASGSGTSSSSTSSFSSLRSTLRSVSSSDSSKKNVSTGDNFRGGVHFGSRRKLTRQRQLLRCDEKKCSNESNEQLPARSSPTSTSVVPQPLPLPEISPASRRKEAGPTVVSSKEIDRPLPSPKVEGSRGVEDRDRDRDRDRDKDKGSGSWYSLPVNYQVRSVFSRPEKTRTTDQAEPSSCKMGHNGSTGSDRFRVEVPTRSAPVSPFSSPSISPQRTSTGDMLPYYYYYMNPKGNQFWSAPEMPTGLPPPAFGDSFYSFDTSPMSSPPGKSIYTYARSPNGCNSSPIPARLSLDSDLLRRGCNTPPEVHPLPLPPGAVTPSSSPPIPQVPTKPESMPLKSQWQKGKLIGRGTFGSVYVASNLETGALCAMKEVELFPDDPKSAECIKQLQQEIKVLSQLKHPNIVQYYGSEIIKDRFFIFLEYVHPGSINKYVREHCGGAVTEAVVRNFTRHILSGLAYLHGTKTIHRDIKGANLLVDSCGVVKLADFGMAKHLTGHAANLSLKGSPYWMAPELMQSVMQKDATSDIALAVDIWSLGCTVIEMLTGNPPWSEYEGVAAMFKVMKDTPSIPETLSPDGKDFLQCCFERNPAERPTAAMLLEHRFIKNYQQLDIPLCKQTFSGMNLPTLSPREPTENKRQQSLISQSSQYKGKVLSEALHEDQLQLNAILLISSETGQIFDHNTSALSVASGPKPRSTFEAVLGPSLPHSTFKGHQFNLSANFLSCATYHIAQYYILR